MSALGSRAGASNTANSSAIADAFARAKSEKRAAFIPYITAGDPDLETSAVLLRVLADSGADIIELGVPFSDPIADGIVNQRAATRALASATTRSGLLELVSRSRDQVGIPIVLFTYFNPLHARGLRLFAEQASASGVDRSRSVSSTRSSIFPPWCRANSSLNTAVRRLPTWNLPVGLGANRTRTSADIASIPG